MQGSVFEGKMLSAWHYSNDNTSNNNNIIKVVVNVSYNGKIIKIDTLESRKCIISGALLSGRVSGWK